jgi:iron complex outermembrane receptor protein
MGAISRLNFHFSDRFSSSLGLQASSNNIQHYQEVRDLLGGSFYYFSGNEFDEPQEHDKQLGAIIGYHHTNRMNRVGFSGDISYTGSTISAFTRGAYSMGSLTHTDHLQRDPENPAQQYTLQPEIAPGFQIKSGISYRVLDDLLTYANYSYISREPNSRLVLDYLEGPVTYYPSNLSIQGFDAGIRYALSSATSIAISVYDYLLANSTLTQKIKDQLNNEYLLHISNIDQRHQGIELDADFRPVRFFGIEANAALGNWKYADYATGTLVDISADNGTGTEYTFRNKNLNTGNAPQLQLGTILSVHPVMNSYIKAGFRFFGHHFSSWNPAGFLTNEKQQVWEIPEYYLLDLHAGYTVTMDSRYRIAIRGHIFNLLDEVYITDAMNNGALNTLPGDPAEYINTAAAASVFIGLPRTFSIGMNVSF